MEYGRTVNKQRNEKETDAVSNSFQHERNCTFTSWAMWKPNWRKGLFPHLKHLRRSLWIHGIFCSVPIHLFFVFFFFFSLIY